LDCPRLFDPQLVSDGDAHDTLHHVPLSQFAGAVQSLAEEQGSPTFPLLVVVPESSPPTTAQYEAVAEAGVQAVPGKDEQSSFVSHPGTQDFAEPLPVARHRFGCCALFAPHAPLDAQGSVHQRPWHVLPCGQLAFVRHGSPTCAPDPSALMAGPSPCAPWSGLVPPSFGIVIEPSPPPLLEPPLEPPPDPSSPVVAPESSLPTA
jgi:hypothetical protein